MRILIAGGTGFIGSALIDNLLRSQHQIVILSRNPKKYTNRYDDNISWQQWDGKTTQGCGHAVENIDCIINLAGENIAGNSFYSIFFKRYTLERKRAILESRLNSGKALIQAVKNSPKKPSTFIQASAVGYYGDRGDEILTESSFPGNDFAASVCIPWENSTLDIEKMNIRRIIIRTAGLVLSKSGGAFPYLLFPYRLFVGGTLGSGKQWVSWIHIKDEIRAIQFLLENQNAKGVFNVSAPYPVSNRDFSRAIGKALHRPSWLPLPEPIFNLLLGEKSKILLSSQRQIPEKLLKLGFTFSFPDIDTALDDLL